MPDVPNKITIDYGRKKVFVDDVEFPWAIDENIGVEPTTAAGLPSATFSIFASEVEVIPECAECDRLDALELDYEVIMNGGKHVRHITDLDQAKQRVHDAEALLIDAHAALDRARRRADA